MAYGYETASQDEGRYQASGVNDDEQANQTGAGDIRAGQASDCRFQDLG